MSSFSSGKSPSRPAQGRVVSTARSVMLRRSGPVAVDMPAFGGVAPTGQPARRAIEPKHAPGFGWDSGLGELLQETQAASPQLSDMLDRASAQLTILRRTLQEAAAVDAIVRKHATELHQRLEQGRHFTGEFDQRLAQAATAAGTLERATVALAGLEQIVTQLQGVQSAAEKRFQQRISEQQEDFQRQLDQSRDAMARLLSERDEKIAGMLAQHQDNSAKQFKEVEQALLSRLGAMQQTIDAAAAQAEGKSRQVQSELEKATRGVERTLKAEADRVAATLDRHTAQAQARVSLILDSASDRLRTMETQAERLGGVVSQRVEALCDKAVSLLGHDPRGDQAGEPAAGSLAAVAEHAKEVLSETDNAAVRLAALLGETHSALEHLAHAAQTAGAQASEQARERDAVMQAVQLGMEQLKSFEVALEAARERQGGALSDMSVAQEELGTLRADLETIANATRYHVTQAKDAQANLARSADAAGQQSSALESAMQQAAEQAQALVGLAKDVTVLAQQLAVLRNTEQGESGQARAAG